MNKSQRVVSLLRPCSSRAALLLTAAAFAGCSALDLGPMPDNYVGPKQNRTIITDTIAVLPASAAATATATAPAGTEPGTASATSPTTLPATLPATQPAMRPGSTVMTVEEAILTALENNPSLRSQRLNPLISRTAEEQARAAFDPSFSGQISGGRTASPSGGSIGSRTNPPGTAYGNSVNGQMSLQQYLPTGTTISGDATTSYSSSDSFSDASTRLGVTVSQALLRGAGLDVNLANLRQAQLNTRITQYELRGFAESLVSQVEQTYWDYVLAQRQIEIYQSSLDLAEQQLGQTNELIAVGRQAESERAAAEAEVATRRESLINAKASLETTRLRLLQLISPGKQEFWNRELIIRQQPFVPQGFLENVDAHVKVALLMRPDLNQARLQIQRGDLEIVQTRNGLLPRLDLFVTMGQTGYARSFGGTIPNLDSPYYDAQVGLRMDYPINNAAARAAYRASVLSREQTQESLDNLTQLAQVDVRTAYIDATRLKEQITATAATRLAQEVALRTETEKFRVGRSTALLVAQAQNNLVQAQISEVQAVVGYLKALINLYQQEGSLLERRGIHAPGAKPATELKLDTAIAPATQPAAS